MNNTQKKTKLEIIIDKIKQRNYNETIKCIRIQKKYKNWQENK